MAGGAVASAKPQLRGLHAATIKTNLIVASGLVVATFVAFKFLYNEPRKQAYAEFYKTYDDKKVLKRMVENGLLQSIESTSEL